MKTSFFPYAAALLVAGLMSGCAISVNNLVPSSPKASAPHFDKTIIVHKVTGAKKTVFGGPAMVTNEDYTEALVSTLKNSNLFKQVVTNSPGEYELTTEIIGHGQGASLNYKSAMIVEYRIVDVQSNNLLWKKGFNSRHEVSVLQAPAGATRTIRAQEGSVRKNLEQFINSLATAKFE